MEASRERLTRSAQRLDGNPAIDRRLRSMLGDRGRRGRLTFAEFMRVALYDPRDGYYRKIGPGRDYTTSPQTSPAFAHMIAIGLGRMWRALDEPPRFTVVELASGGGRLASDMRSYLTHRDPACAAAVRIVSTDVSAPGVDLRADAIALPFRGIVGCVLSNELFDALPVHRVIRLEDGGLGELWVALYKDRLVWHIGPVSDRAVESRSALPTRPGQIVDVSLEAARVVRESARVLQRGYVLTIDYGGETDELRGPRHFDGTALAHHHHRPHDRLLDRPGDQDLTTQVDFTELRARGEESGLITVAYTSQRQALLGLGLRRWTELLDPTYLSQANLLGARQAALALIAPGGLGAFRVLIQGRGVPPADGIVAADA